MRTTERNLYRVSIVLLMGVLLLLGWKYLTLESQQVSTPLVRWCGVERNPKTGRDEWTTRLLTQEQARIRSLESDNAQLHDENADLKKTLEGIRRTKPPQEK
jgi:hypothetical protein